MAQLPLPRLRSRSPEKSRRITIAEGIRSAVDSKAIASGLSQKLKNAKLLHEMLQKRQKDQMHAQSSPKSHEERPPSAASERARSASSVYRRSDIIEEDLPSKKDLLAQVGATAAEPSHFDQQVEKAAMLNDAQLSANPLRSHHLWSKKSLDMFKRMYKYTASIVPEYEFLKHYSKGDTLGVVDTFLAYESVEHIENFYSSWAHFNQRFEINKAHYFQSEIEPLAMMLARDGAPEQNLALRPNHVAYTILNSLLGHATAAQDHRNTMEEANRKHHEDDDIRPGVGGEASIVHLRATLLGALKTPAEVEASVLGDGPEDSESETGSGNLRTHVRPLFTAGDLMLALFELADPKLFKSGSIQLFGRLAMKDPIWSPEVNFFRVEYTMLMPNKWSYYRPKHDLYLRDADLLAFISPSTCPKAFEITAMDASIETTAMKIWVTSFVRNCLGFREDDSSVLESAIINVQIVRRIDDGYLYFSQVQHPTKEQLAAHEQRRDDILWREQIAISQCDIAQLVRDGDGYSTHIRVVDVNDVKITNRESIKTQAVMLSNIKKARIRRRMRATMHVRSIGLQLARHQSLNDADDVQQLDNGTDQNDQNSDQEGIFDLQIGEMTHEEFLDTYRRYFADQIPRFITRAKPAAININSESFKVSEDALTVESGESALGEDGDTFAWDGDEVDVEARPHGNSEIRSEASTADAISGVEGSRVDDGSSVTSHAHSHFDSDASSSDADAIKKDASQASLVGVDADGADATEGKASSKKKKKRKSAVENKGVVAVESPKKDLLSKFIPKHGAVRRLSASELNRKKELGVRLKHGNYANEEVGDFLQLCTALVKNKKDEEADEFFKNVQNEDQSGSSGDEIKELGKNKVSVAKTHYERSKNRREYLQQLRAHEQAKQAKMAELQILEEMAAIRKAQREIIKNNPAFVITSDLLRGTSDTDATHASKEASRRISVNQVIKVDFQAEIAKRIALSRISNAAFNATKVADSEVAKKGQHSGEVKLNHKHFESDELSKPIPHFELLPMAYLKRTHQLDDEKRVKRRRKRRKTKNPSDHPSKPSRSFVRIGDSYSSNVNSKANHRESIKSKHYDADTRTSRRNRTHKSRKTLNAGADVIQTDDAVQLGPVDDPAVSDKPENTSNDLGDEERASFDKVRQFFTDTSEDESTIGDSGDELDGTNQTIAASPAPLTSRDNQSSTSATVEYGPSHTAVAFVLDSTSYQSQTDVKVIRDTSKQVVDFVIVKSFGQVMAQLTSRPLDSSISRSNSALVSSSGRGLLDMSHSSAVSEIISASTFPIPVRGENSASQTATSSLIAPSNHADHGNNRESPSPLSVIPIANKPLSLDQGVKYDKNTDDQDAPVFHNSSATNISSPIYPSTSKDSSTVLPLQQAQHSPIAPKKPSVSAETYDLRDQHISVSNAEGIRKVSVPPAAPTSSVAHSVEPLVAIPSSPNVGVATTRDDQRVSTAEENKRTVSILFPSVGRASASPPRSSLVINDSDFSEEEGFGREFKNSAAKRLSSTTKPRHSVDNNQFESGKALEKSHYRKLSNKSELKMQSIILNPGEASTMWECTMRVNSPTKVQSEPKPQPPLDPPPSYPLSARLTSLGGGSHQDKPQVGGTKTESPNTDIPYDIPKKHSILPAINEKLEPSAICSLQDDNEIILGAGDSVDDHMMHLDLDYFLSSPEKPEDSGPHEGVPQSQSPKLPSNFRKHAVRVESSSIISKSSNPLVNKTARLLFAASQSLYRQGPRNINKPPSIGSKPHEPKGHTGAFLSKGRRTTESKAEEKIIDDAKFLVKNKEVLANQTGLERAMRVPERHPIAPLKNSESKFGSMPKRPGRNIVGASVAPSYRVVTLPGPPALHGSEGRAVWGLDLTALPDAAMMMRISDRASGAQPHVSLPADPAVSAEGMLPEPGALTDSDVDDAEDDAPLRTPSAPTRVVMRTVVRLHPAPSDAQGETAPVEQEVAAEGEATGAQ